MGAFREFGFDTSAHGIAFLFGSKKLLFRIFWFVLVLAACIGMAFVSYMIVSEYLDQKATVSIRTVQTKNHQFPAITFCNQNPISKTNVKLVTSGHDPQHSINSSNVQQLNSTYEELANGNETNTDVMQSRLRRQLQSSLIKFGPNFMQTYGSKLEDMLLDCTFQDDIRCSTVNFTTWTHGIYGNCHTLYINRHWHPSMVPGIEHGLKLKLFVNGNDYLPTINHLHGIRMSVHPQGIMPVPANQGFNVPTASGTSVAVTSNKVERFGYTKCDKYEQENVFPNTTNFQHVSFQYSLSSCFDYCMMKTSIDACGCLLPDIINVWIIKRLVDETNTGNVTSTICDAADRVCVKENVYSVAQNTCPNQCTNLCQQEMYSTQISTTRWSSTNSLLTSMVKWASTNPKFYDLVNTTLTPFLSALSTNSDMMATLNEIQNNRPSTVQTSSTTTTAATSHPRSTTTTSHPTTANGNNPKMTCCNDDIIEHLATDLVLQKIRDNIVAIDVYFEHLGTTLTEEIPRTTLFELLCIMGGASELFIGVSFLTIVEFVCFAVGNRTSKDNDDKDNDNDTDSDSSSNEVDDAIKDKMKDKTKDKKKKKRSRSAGSTRTSDDDDSDDPFDFEGKDMVDAGGTIYDEFHAPAAIKPM